MYTVTTLTTRPAGAKWFAEVYPAASTTDIAWVKAQPGFVSWTTTFDAGKDTYETVLTFADKVSYDAMDAARKTNAEYQARLAHASSNGIAFTKSFS